MVKVFDLDGTLLDSNGIWRWVDETSTMPSMVRN